MHTLAAEVVKAEEQSEHILSEFRDDSQPDVAAFVKNYRAAKLVCYSVTGFFFFFLDERLCQIFDFTKFHYPPPFFFCLKS